MWNDYGFIRPGRAPDYIPTPPRPVPPTPVILLSNSTVLDTAPIGTTVGLLSITNGTGNYTFTLESNPGSLFAINGSALITAESLAPPTPPSGSATFYILGF